MTPASCPMRWSTEGAVGRVGPVGTAFSGRAAAYTYNLISTWTDPAEDGKHIGANRDLAAQLAAIAERLLRELPHRQGR